MHLTFLIGSNLCHEINLLQTFKCSSEKMFQTSIQIKRSVRPPPISLTYTNTHTHTHIHTHFDMYSKRQKFLSEQEKQGMKVGH